MISAGRDPRCLIDRERSGRRGAPRVARRVRLARWSGEPLVVRLGSAYPARGWSGRDRLLGGASAGARPGSRGAARVRALGESLAELPQAPVQQRASRCWSHSHSSPSVFVTGVRKRVTRRTISVTNQAPRRQPGLSAVARGADCPCSASIGPHALCRLLTSRATG